jgi:hypothetical protein
VSTTRIHAVKYSICISAGLLLTAGLAALTLRQATGHAHLGDLLIVTAITVVSGHLAMAPIWMLRKSAPVVLFQAAFAGTVLHLFITLVVGAAVYALRLVGDRGMFLFLLLGFYWFSLIFVIGAMIKVFRRCAASQTTGEAGLPIQTKSS